MTSANDASDSVIAITVTDPKDSSVNDFGTAFTIYEDEQAVYFLTCAHVVEYTVKSETAIVTSNIVTSNDNNITLKVLFRGDSNGIDLAILQMSKQDNQENTLKPFNLSKNIVQGRNIKITGFYKSDKTTFKQELAGKLDSKTTIYQGKKSAEAWYIDITSKNFVIEQGYSGSPVIDAETNCVIAVARHRENKGQRALAISVKAVAEIWPNLLNKLMAADDNPIEASLEQVEDEIENQPLPNNWLLTYIGEDQLIKLNESLVNDLTNPSERLIQSAYSYWGAGPTKMWLEACDARDYVMHYSIKHFSNCARPLLENNLNQDKGYNFVSLGVGNGEKDAAIIFDFFNHDSEFLYIPVDTSLDMLKEAAKQLVITRLPLRRRIAIQRDITDYSGIQQISTIAKQLGKARPVLYGFLGNTIANLEDPGNVIENIVEVMHPEDLLLFEAQVINPSAFEEKKFPDTIRRVKMQYQNDYFRRFAESALKQNCDIPIPAKERKKYYEVNVEKENSLEGTLLKIDCLFKNISDSTLDIILLDKKEEQLQPQESIRLYRSRKYPVQVLKEFLQKRGLQVLGEQESISDRDIGLGFVVLLVKRK